MTEFFADKTPADIVNRALDMLGVPEMAIGELNEGTAAANPAIRAYGPAMRQLLRAAPWNFARKQAPLELLADATGQTPYIGTQVQAPWTYCYAQPIDCLKVRFLPWNTNPVQPNPPIMTGINQPPLTAIRLIPAPYIVALDYNYPVVTGVPPTWDQTPQWWSAAGTGPTQRTVINTNVPPQPQGTNPTIYPSLVYTALVIYPSQWDALFEEALVAYLTSKLAMAVVKDKKLARVIRDDAIKSAKEMIVEARLVNANESAYPQTTAHIPDWIRIRAAGTGMGFGNNSDQWGGTGNAMGSCWNYDQLGFSDGSVY